MSRQASKKAVLLTAAAAMTQHNLKAALASWRHAAAERVRLRRTLQTAVLKLQRNSLATAHLGWRAAVVSQASKKLCLNQQ